MMKLPLLTAAALLLSALPAAEAGAQNLQPGMRTMIQRGGSEGVQLGALFPFAGAAPHPDPYAEDPAYPSPAHDARRYRSREALKVRN